MIPYSEAELIALSRDQREKFPELVAIVTEKRAKRHDR